VRPKRSAYNFADLPSGSGQRDSSCNGLKFSNRSDLWLSARGELSLGVEVAVFLSGEAHGIETVQAAQTKFFPAAVTRPAS